MFTYTDENGNFIVESGSAVPVMKVSESVIYISGSILPFEASSNAFSEIGSLDKPFKELYVESASINFVDTSKARDHADRRVKFSKVDVDNLKSGRPIHPDGHLSASGDLYVSGSTSLIGRTDILGETRIDGLTDVRGGFRVNGTAITDAELQALRGLSTGAGSIQTQLDAKHNVINAGNRLNASLIGGGNVTSIEFNQLDGIGTSTIATQLAAKQDTITFGISNTNVIKCGDGIVDNDFLRIDGTTLEGRSASELKGDLSLVKGDVGLGNVDNTSDASKPVSTATQTALNKKLNLTGGTMTGLIQPIVTAVKSVPNKGVIDARVTNVFEFNIKSGGTVSTATPAFVGQELTIANIGQGAITITHTGSKPTPGTFFIYGGKNLAIATGQVYKFVYTNVNQWFVIQ